MEVIPISVAEKIGKKFKCKQVLLLTFDGERTHIVTWGKTKKDCEEVAIAQEWWDGKVFPKSME